jgi:hypothetical protein
VTIRKTVLGFYLLGALLLAGCGAEQATSTPIVTATPAPTGTTAAAISDTPTTGATETTAAPTDTAVAMTTPTAAMAPTTPTETGAMGTPGEATPTETGAVGTPAAAAGDPKSTVQAFLTAVQQNPTGTDAAKYLSSYLASRVDAGKSIASLLGVQNVWQSFTVGDPKSGELASNAVVRATLHFTEGDQMRDFSLFQDPDGWHITTIAPVTAGQ